MSEADEDKEPLNVYDADGNVVGAMPRAEAKSSGLAVGAVNILLVNRAGEVLLQRRAAGKENGGLWDKSVGGHVAAGEEFDEAAVREAGEELFGDPASPRVMFAAGEEGFRASLAGVDLREAVVFRSTSRQLNLRDVRHGPDGTLRNVLYHVAIYLGRTDVPKYAFRPQASELAGLDYVAPRAVDEMLLAGRLAPNMAFLWLTHAHALLAR